MTTTAPAVDTPHHPRPMSGDTHRQLHWAAIRSVCRNRDLPPHTRRAKLRFLVEGLARSATWGAAHAPGSAR